MIVYDLITRYIEAALRSLNVGPEAYLFMFPPEVDLARINQMVADKVFPTVEGLAPAFTYAILLTFARFFLHLLVFKVIVTTKHSNSVSVYGLFLPFFEGLPINSYCAQVINCILFFVAQLVLYI